MIIVQKYGGTSVASLEKISAIAKELKEIAKDLKIVVVVSAMGKKTNELLEKATFLDKKATGREVDALLSTGEIETASLLALALKKEGVKAKSLSGRQAGIFTSLSHNKAYIEKIDCKNLLRHLKVSDVLVVAGFQGMNSLGDITTLGRGGSDTTAVALASALNAPCEIYTDVAGVHTTNPKDFEKAKSLKFINYNEIIELAFSGAKVLDVRAIEIAKKYNTPVFVGQSLEKDKSKGTYIFSSHLDQTSFLKTAKQKENHNNKKDLLSKDLCSNKNKENTKNVHFAKQKGILKCKNNSLYASLFEILIKSILHYLQKILLENCQKCDFSCSKPRFYNCHKTKKNKCFHFTKQQTKDFCDSKQNFRNSNQDFHNSNQDFCNSKQNFESPVITGLATKNIRQFTIQTSQQKEFFEKICEKSLFLEMFSQNEKSISFACPEDSFENVKQTFASFSPTTSKSLVKITLVGSALATHPKIIAKIFASLETADIKVISSELSDLSLSIVISPRYKDIAIKTLCQNLNL